MSQTMTPARCGCAMLVYRNHADGSVSYKVKGKASCTKCQGYGHIQECANCSGCGLVNGSLCPTCCGSGVVAYKQEVPV